MVRTSLLLQKKNSIQGGKRARSWPGAGALDRNKCEKEIAAGGVNSSR
jgi:hypothetical protein